MNFLFNTYQDWAIMEQLYMALQHLEGQYEDIKWEYHRICWGYINHCRDIQKQGFNGIYKDPLVSSNVAGKSPRTECLSGKIIDFQRVKDATEGNDKWGWSHCIVCIPKDMTTYVEVDNLNHQKLQVQGTCCVPDSLYFAVWGP